MDGHRPHDPGSTSTTLSRAWHERRYLLDVAYRRLGSAQRIAFVLHDVFGFSFDAVRSIVGRSPASCRHHSGRVVAAVALTVRDGLVKHVHTIANPYKLAYVMSPLQPNE